MPVADHVSDDVYYQEVDVVITSETLLTVRKTTPGHAPYSPDVPLAAARETDSPGRMFYRLADDVADRYLDLVDALEDEIGAVEDGVDEWSSDQVRSRVRQIRHQILHVRRTLAPLRDAMRSVADGRVDLAGENLFTPELEQELFGVYDTSCGRARGSSWHTTCSAAHATTTRRRSHRTRTRPSSG